jgi:hypothetical protein
MLFMVPFLILVFSFLVLFYAGRSFKEKLTLFFCNPDNAVKGSLNLFNILRMSFWLSFFICAWMIISIIRHKV